MWDQKVISKAIRLSKQLNRNSKTIGERFPLSASQDKDEKDIDKMSKEGDKD